MVTTLIANGARRCRVMFRGQTTVKDVGVFEDVATGCDPYTGWTENRDYCLPVSKLNEPRVGEPWRQSLGQITW